MIVAGRKERRRMEEKKKKKIGGEVGYVGQTTMIDWCRQLVKLLMRWPGSSFSIYSNIKRSFMSFSFIIFTCLLTAGCRPLFYCEVSNVTDEDGI